MFNQLSDLEIILIIVSAFLIGIIITVIFTTLIIKKQLRNIHLAIVGSNLELHKARLDSDLKQDETDKNIKMLAEKVDHLSSSTTAFMTIMKQKERQTHMPLPDEVKNITATIEDQISIELLKSLDLNAPSNEYVVRITDNVSRTYPNIDLEYIANKVIAVIQAFNNQERFKQKEE